MIGTPSVMKNNRSALGTLLVHRIATSMYVDGTTPSWNKIFTKNVEFRTGRREHAFIRNV